MRAIPAFFSSAVRSTWFSSVSAWTCRQVTVSGRVALVAEARQDVGGSVGGSAGDACLSCEVGDGECPIGAGGPAFDEPLHGMFEGCSCRWADGAQVGLSRGARIASMALMWCWSAVRWAAESFWTVRSSRLPVIAFLIAGACLTVTQELRQSAGWQWLMTGAAAGSLLERSWRRQTAVAGSHGFGNPK
jgi:hypothetical protein